MSAGNSNCPFCKGSGWIDVNGNRFICGWMPILRTPNNIMKKPFDFTITLWIIIIAFAAFVSSCSNTPPELTAIQKEQRRIAQDSLDNHRRAIPPYQWDEVTYNFNEVGHRSVVHATINEEFVILNGDEFYDGAWDKNSFIMERDSVNVRLTFEPTRLFLIKKYKTGRTSIDIWYRSNPIEH